MRKANETPICSYTVSVFADSDKLDEPTGSGSDANSFAQEISENLKNHLTQNSPDLAGNYEGWQENDLRVEITPVI